MAKRSRTPTRRGSRSQPNQRKSSPRNRSPEALAYAQRKRLARDAAAEGRRRAMEEWAAAVGVRREALKRAVSAGLSTLIGESPTAFERRVGVPHGTLQGWLQAGKKYAALARLEMLAVVCDKTDTSLDWLAGYEVPQRRSDREPVGEIARALVDHVLGDYLKRRMGHRYVDGIAQVLRGEFSGPWSRDVVVK